MALYDPLQLKPIILYRLINSNNSIRSMIEMIDDYAKMISSYAISLFYNNIIMLLFVPIL